jgi:hypothetical protein
MRNCPVCGYHERRILWSQEFLVPEGWTLPPFLDRYFCLSCGMVYADHPTITQEDYDEFYISKYGYWGEGPEARGHHKDVAEAISQTFPRETFIVDFGGGREALQMKALEEIGYKNYRIYDLGGSMPAGADLIIAQQVLEHIYDMESAMRLIATIREGGTLIVEGPELTTSDLFFTPPIVDWHQKHLNHFRIDDYIRLMKRWGFQLISHSQFTYYNIVNARLVFIQGEPTYISLMHKDRVIYGVDRIVSKMLAIGDREVIVWGCGDLAMHALTKVKLNVKYFVDKNPVYWGEIIANRPVLRSVDQGDLTPIVVIAQGQKQDIIANIKTEGLQNEVIVC